MLLNRQQLGALAFASTDSSRQALQHLRIDPDGTIWATNGYTLIRVKSTGAPSDDEFPCIDTIPADAQTPKTSILLPVATAKAVLASLKKVKHGRLPILAHALLKQKGDRLFLATTDLETPQVFEVKVPNATFPTVEGVLPGGKFGGGTAPEAGVIGINPHYLGAVAAYHRLFDTPKDIVRITGQGPTSATLFEWEDGHGHEVLIIVMPVRL